jgi:hypothetical protein
MDRAINKRMTPKTLIFIQYFLLREFINKENLNDLTCLPTTLYFNLVQINV